MSFFTRWAEKWITSLETSNPEAVYESALLQQEEAIAGNKDVLTSAIVRRNKLSNEVEALEEGLRRVMTNLAAAVEHGEDETALVLIQGKEDLVTQLETLTTQLDQAQEHVIAAKANFQRARENLGTLTREKTQAIAELQVALAKLTVENANSAFSDDPTARGLTSVRESIERLESRAHKGYFDSEGNSIRAKVEANRERSAEARARDELSQLRAASDETPEPSDDVGQQADDGPKKRTM
jgi:phage shock protein A